MVKARDGRSGTRNRKEFGMTELQSKESLQAAGEVRQAPMTRKALLLHVRGHFREKGSEWFKMPLELEHKPLDVLRSMPVAGHVFAEIATALGTAGVATDGTMGSVMDALGFNEIHAHLFCGCHTLEHDGYALGMVFRALAEHA